MKLTPEMKKYILDAIRQKTGDNLERATFAFGDLTEEELGQEHGFLGCTRRELLDGYRQERILSSKCTTFIEEI